MPGLHPKKTLVPVDFSDRSIEAVDRALEIAGDEGVVEVIHVLTELLAMEPGNLFGTITNDPRVDAARERLAEAFADARYKTIKFHVAIGDPGREIASQAERDQIDLIVIPSHGRGFVKRVLLGSVAERVLRFAPCAVLVLRS